MFIYIFLPQLVHILPILSIALYAEWHLAEQNLGSLFIFLTMVPHTSQTIFLPSIIVKSGLSTPNRILVLSIYAAAHTLEQKVPWSAIIFLFFLISLLQFKH